MHAIVYTDGASRGNPGPSGIGVVVRNESHDVIETYAGYVGVTTNNHVEYQALIKGLQMALARGCTEVSMRLDSQVVVRQVLGEYRVKDTRLELLHAWVMDLLGRFDRWEIAHVRREMNAFADKLANDGIDNHLKVGA